MTLFGRELRFGAPDVAEIAIFDETNSHIVRQALPANRTVGVLKVRPEDLWISSRIALHMVGLLRRLRWADAKRHPAGVARGLLFQLRGIYLEACLAAMRPKAVVTFIDNSGPFGWLSKRCRRFPFFAIQNGTRLSFAATDHESYYCQQLFCFGRHEIDQFPRLGYQVEKFHPVGSLLASLSFRPAEVAPAVVYDLLVVSTWRGNIGFGPDVQDTMRSMRIMDELLAEYIRSRKLTAAIVLRAEREKQHWRMAELNRTEEDYFREIYGDEAAIVDTDFATRNVFPMMQQSRLIVSCLSTALLEAFGIGKKILYCNFTGTDRYHDHLDAELVATDSRAESFFDRLDLLRSMSGDEYSRHYGRLQEYYMANPSSEVTQSAIARIIDAAIAGAGA